MRESLHSIKKIKDNSLGEVTFQVGLEGVRWRKDEVCGMTLGKGLGRGSKQLS